MNILKKSQTAALLAALTVSAACAHLPKDLGLWAAGKSLKLAECTAKHPDDRGELKACLGPNYIRDLGTEACERTHGLLESLPAE